jgi:hypothetical protein
MSFSNFVKIVDCRVFIIDRASRGGFNGGLFENRSFLTATTNFSPSKWSNFHRYTMKEGLPTSITTTGVIPSSMRFKWSYYREISGVIIVTALFLARREH